MFGNKELQETRDQLGRAIDFWANAIIKMDPVARKLTISQYEIYISCLLYTSPSPRDRTRSRMPSSA